MGNKETSCKHWLGLAADVTVCFPELHERAAVILEHLDLLFEDGLCFQSGGPG